MSSPKLERASTSSSKSKKEKSSKKRKAESLVDPVIAKEATPERQSSPATKSASPEPSANEEADNNEEPAKKRKKIDVEEIEVDITKPEPPSKKALRALKKGKPLPPPKAGAETTPEPEQKPKKEVEKRSEHGIWIGNMAFHTSKEDLRTFLVEKSDLTPEMITRINMPGPNDHKSANSVSTSKYKRVEHNKGFAYVDFSTAKGTEIALELSEELLSGRRVLIKDSKSFVGRPEKTKEEQRQEGKPPSKRVFLGNLAYDNTEDSLKDHFEKCGAVESVKVATFEDSGKCKGFAWIVFEELEAAQAAVKGYVMVEEELSDEEESDSELASDADVEVEVKPKRKNIKKRKVWVNKIKGRPLRMEFAEDAQVRYKKRYGKDGTKNASAPRSAEAEVVVDGPVKPSKTVEYRKDYAPRLTGGIVESKGTKVTF